jgi:hypothetical protein
VTRDEDTSAKREKTERDPTDEPPTMRTLADAAPVCRMSGHNDRGTDCDGFDQETLAIGTRATILKELPALIWKASTLSGGCSQRFTAKSSSSVIE